eukprot:gnl/MRDRNA2_/MRDRNA2_117431_c0_seq1.p1 gnl/MRDRNA2_/MRDRNA2_117431_c0~~gnl/MRDRNA2_/MRDRNA2_117431_c0_seq1.p1  ORF type:complete len:255 (-),score=45.58 gnl/MRDRNA2_/MRDRNA2_117431_c0_seq1:75-776(-)
MALQSTGRRTLAMSARGSSTLPAVGGAEDGLDPILQLLDSQSKDRTKTVGSARKPKVEKSLEEKRQEMQEAIAKERASRPKRDKWRGDGVGREFHHLEAGYLVPLDVSQWKYETISSRIDANRRPPWRGPDRVEGGGECGDPDEVPLTPAVKAFLERHERQYIRFVSRRRIAEGLMVTPRCFDLSAGTREPFKDPPPHCRFLGFLDELDPSELQYQRRQQARRFQQNSKAASY